MIALVAPLLLGAGMMRFADSEVRRYLRDGQERQLVHVHMQTAALQGNLTELMYYYVDVFLGSNRDKQALIVDTGSSVAAVRCKNYCRSCGDKHISPPFDLDSSASKYVLQCKADYLCKCTPEEGRCYFEQKYGEGSMYKGFLVSDGLHFGERYHTELDKVKFTFGCIEEETNMFYSQEADGILGMARETTLPYIAERMFSLCLGKDGGYF
jgi:hypothetical protein